jgi:hypothetical protein
MFSFFIGHSIPVMTKRRTTDSEAVRSPQKTVDPATQITELRDLLLATCDFEAVPLPKLIALHDHLPSYMRSCISDRQFQQASAARNLTDAIETELMRQSRIWDAHRAKVQLSRVISMPVDPLLAEFDAETLRRAHRMADRQSRLLSAFDRVWASSVSRRYRGATPQLWEMRAQYSRSPDPALAKVIALREAREREIAARQYADDYARARARLVGQFRAEAARMRAMRGKQRIFIAGRSAGVIRVPIDPSPLPRPFSWTPTYQTRQRLLAARAKATSFAATRAALPPLADAAVQLEEDELARPDTPLVIVGDNFQLVPMADPNAEEEEQQTGKEAPREAAGRPEDEQEADGEGDGAEPEEQNGKEAPEEGESAAHEEQPEEEEQDAEGPDAQAGQMDLITGDLVRLDDIRGVLD